jgi:predicted ester cyclase
MKKSLLLVMVFSLILVCMPLSFQGQVAEGITEEQAKAFMDVSLKIWNEGNLALADQWFSPDFVMHDPMYPEPIVGVKAFKDVLSAESKTFPDENLKFEDFLIKGDKIAIIWTWTATHSGPMVKPSGEIPPTGNKVKMSGVAVCRLVKGKVVEFWQYTNTLDLFSALGYTLTPPQPPKSEVKE